MTDENKTPPEPAPPALVVDTIDKLYAFTADIDGKEMILTGVTPKGMTMFVTGEKGDMFKMMSEASQEVADGMGKTVRLVVFERKEIEVKFEGKLIIAPPSLMNSTDGIIPPK